MVIYCVKMNVDCLYLINGYLIISDNCLKCVNGIFISSVEEMWAHKTFFGVLTLATC